MKKISTFMGISLMTFCGIAGDGYHVMRLESDCGCSKGSYKVMVKYADGESHRVSINSDGLVYIPIQPDGLPDYERVVGVGVVSYASFPGPGRVIKECSAMPYDPLQAHWVPPQDGGIIPIYCPNDTP